MPAPKGQGIADDAADYEDLAKKPERGAKSGPGKGIADDSSLFEDLVSEDTGKARTLDSDWIYQLNGQVFGPVKPKDLLELLYSGEINADTPIALDGSEFQALQRYGVFRVHLPKVARHQQELADARDLEKKQTNARLRRRLMFVAFAVTIGAASTYGIVQYVRMRKEEAARLEARAKEDALMKEIDRLMASVTIEPPLIELVDEKEAANAPGKKRSRRVARFSGGSGAATGEGGTGELTRAEIMGGVAKVFPSFKRCIVEQIQRDADSVPETIVLSFSINNDGVPQDVSVGDRALRSTPLGQCMTRHIAEVRYRKFKGEVQNVEYPITIGRQ
jgi:hypothetical protein